MILESAVILYAKAYVPHKVLTQLLQRHARSIFNLLMELDFLIAPLSLSVITNSIGFENATRRSSKATWMHIGQEGNNI